MADELDTGNSILDDQSTASMRDLIDAMRTLTESNVEVSNKLTELVDTQNRPQVNIVANRPKTARKSMSALSDHLDKLIESRSKIGKEGLGQLTSILGKLNTNIDVLHSSLQAMVKKLDVIGSAQTTSIRVSGKNGLEGKLTKQQKDDIDRERAIRRVIYNNSENTRHFNNYARLNPVLRNFFPKTTAFGRHLANYGDMLSSAGMKGAGGALGGWGVGIARMSPMALGGAFAVLATIQAVTALTKRMMANGASAYAMEGITGGNYTFWSQEKARVRAGTYGMSGDEFFKTQQRYAKSGIRDVADVFAGIRAEKYFGVENLDKYFQRLARSTNDTTKYATDLGRSLFRLRAISEQTSMGISEVMQHQTGFMDAFKGQTYKFNGDEVVGILSNFKKLIDSYELTGQEIGSFYNAGQRVDTNTLLTATHFAGVGGYRFRTEGDILDRAYEVRRMGSGSLLERANLFKSQLKGLYSLFGVDKFDQLSGRQKFMLTEQIMPQTLGVDVSKLPSAEAVIKQLEKGGSTTYLDKETFKSIEDAKKTNLDTVVRNMALLQNPVETIKNFLLAGAYGNAAQRQLEIAEKDKKSQEEKNNGIEKYQFTVMDATEKGLKIISNTPGKKADVIQSVRSR